MGYLYTIILAFLGTLISAVALHGSFSLAGIFFLGVPVTMKMAIYTLAIAERAGLAPELAFLLALLSSIAVGVIFAFLFVKLSADSFAVVGLAALLASEALLRSWDGVTNGILGIAGIARPGFLPSLPSLVIAVGVVAAVLLLFQYIFLQTWIGRAVRAYKENEISLEALGLPTKKIAQPLIVITSVIASLAAIFQAWRIQFIEPGVAGLPMLIEVLTVAILALKPSIRAIVLASLFVSFFPEILRFLHLPTTVMGYARLLLYSVVLLILIRKMAPRLATANRSI